MFCLFVGFFCLVWSCFVSFSGRLFAVTCISIAAFNLCLKFATVNCQHLVEGMSGKFCTVQVRMVEFLS